MAPDRAADVSPRERSPRVRRYGASFDRLLLRIRLARHAASLCFVGRRARDRARPAFPLRQRSRSSPVAVAEHGRRGRDRPGALTAVGDGVDVVGGDSSNTSYSMDSRNANTNTTTGTHTSIAPNASMS